ncbi:MAG: hypothetical protein FWG40_03680 [Peptococcaceae bacterium]|nr:hypothetical protein [Peptococcaceae bacterium]
MTNHFEKAITLLLIGIFCLSLPSCNIRERSNGATSIPFLYVVKDTDDEESEAKVMMGKWSLADATLSFTDEVLFISEETELWGIGPIIWDGESFTLEASTYKSETIEVNPHFHYVKNKINIWGKNCKLIINELNPYEYRIDYLDQGNLLTKTITVPESYSVKDHLYAIEPFMVNAISYENKRLSFIVTAASEERVIMLLGNCDVEREELNWTGIELDESIIDHFPDVYFPDSSSSVILDDKYYFKMRHSDIISCADLKTGKVKQLDRLSERCMAILVDDKTIVNSKADTWLEKNYLSGVYNNTLIFGNTAYNGAHILVAVQNEKILGSIVFENNRIKVLNAKDKVVSDYDDEDYWSYGFPTYSRKLPL